MRNTKPHTNRPTAKPPQGADNTAPLPLDINFWITVAGTSPSSRFTLILETSRRPSFPVHCQILRLPSRIRQPGYCLRHLSRANYAIAIQLEGATSPAEFLSLYAKTTAELTSALRETSADWPTTVGIHIAQGRATVTIHERK